MAETGDRARERVTAMRIDPIELSVGINRSPADVFEYIRDFSHEPGWQADAIEIVPEPAGPVQVGTRIRNKRKTPFGTQSFTMEVVELDETARRVKDVAADGMFAGTTAELSVDADGAASVFRVRMVPEVNGVVATLGRFGFVRDRIHRTLNDGWSRNLAQLARLLNED